MGYFLKREFVADLRQTGIRYIEDDDACTPESRPFEGDDGHRYGWADVTNDDGDVFNHNGDAIGSLFPPETCPDCGINLKAEGYPLAHRSDEGKPCTFDIRPFLANEGR